jgi:surfactin synthase thioesterase subunit
LATVRGGGHYFLQHQPEALSEILQRSLAETEPERPAAALAASSA